MVVLTVCFALQQVNQVYFRFPIEDFLFLSPEGLKRGFIYQLLTFQFLHGGLGHLICNLVALWFAGNYLEQTIGRRHFLIVYLLSGVVGGLLQGLLGIAFPGHFGGSTVGASAGVFALIAVFCLLQPHASFLVFFVLPVPAKFLFYALGGMALFFTLVPADRGVAHAAHLGGFLTGIAYLRWVVQSTGILQNWSPPELLRRARRARSVPANPARPSKPERKIIPLPSDQFMSEEVDPILDKITAQGIQSLTDHEKEVLERARAKVNNRK